MSTMFFSASSLSFFPAELMEDYAAAGTWPQDAKEVTELEFQQFGCSHPPAGMQRGALGGKPAWVPVPDLSADQQRAMLSVVVQSELDATARGQGFDSMADAITYADEPAVPSLQALGKALRSWRSLVQVRFRTMTSQAKLPTADELRAALPAFVAPT